MGTTNQSLYTETMAFADLVHGFTEAELYYPKVAKRLPIVKYVNLEGLTLKDRLLIAHELYILGKEHGKTWILKSVCPIDSDIALDLLREYSTPDRVAGIRYRFYVRYPELKDLRVEGVLENWKAFTKTVEDFKEITDNGYISYEERAIISYYAAYAKEHPSVVEVPEDSEYYMFITERLKYRGVFHLTGEYNGHIYTVMTSYKDKKLSIYGRLRDELRQST